MLSRRFVWSSIRHRAPWAEWRKHKYRHMSNGHIYATPDPHRHINWFDWNGNFLWVSSRVITRCGFVWKGTWTIYTLQCLWYESRYMEHQVFFMCVFYVDICVLCSGCVARSQSRLPRGWKSRQPPHCCDCHRDQQIPRPGGGGGWRLFCHRSGSVASLCQQNFPGSD